MDAMYACFVLLASLLPGATIQTTNFVVTAPDPEFAQQVAGAAEYYRRELAIAWTGREMPRWSQKCPISCKVGEYGASGATSFNFDQGEVYGWRMNVQGTAERILDSVLPHEVNHTIFASYFRRPLPRWADEGAASLIEHESERMRLKKIHEQVMRTSRKIPLRQLLPMREYPSDTQQVLTLYAEGYSLADFLIQQSSKGEYLRFLSLALHSGWSTALQQSYGYASVEDLERDLDGWILAGSPDLASPEGQQLALSNAPSRRTAPTIRAQSDGLTIQLGAASNVPPVTPFREDRPSGMNPLDVGRSVVARDPRQGLELPLVVLPATTDGRLPRSHLVNPALSTRAAYP